MTAHSQVLEQEAETLAEEEHHEIHDDESYEDGNEGNGFDPSFLLAMNTIPVTYGPLTPAFQPAAKPRGAWRQNLKSWANSLKFGFKSSVWPQAKSPRLPFASQAVETKPAPAVEIIDAPKPWLQALVHNPASMVPDGLEFMEEAERHKLYREITERLFRAKINFTNAGISTSYSFRRSINQGAPHALTDDEYGVVATVANALSRIIAEVRLKNFSMPTHDFFNLLGNDFMDVLLQFMPLKDYRHIEQFARIPAEELEEFLAGQPEEDEEYAPEEEEELTEPEDAAEAAIEESVAGPAEEPAPVIDPFALRQYAEADRTCYSQLTGIERSDLGKALDKALAHMPEGHEKDAKKKGLSYLIARFIVEFEDERLIPTDRLELILSNEYASEDADAGDIHAIARSIRKGFPCGAEIRRRQRLGYLEAPQPGA